MEWNLIKSKNESPDDSLYMVFRDRRTGEVVGLISEGKGIYINIRPQSGGQYLSETLRHTGRPMNI